MGIHRGPNPVNDGLVFGYDTGYGIANNTTPTRFYPGKSTANLLTSSGAQSLDVRSDIYNNVTKTNIGNGKYRFVNDGTGSTTVRVLANVNDLVDGQYYGCSVSYEELNTGGYVHLDWCDTTNTSFTQASYGSANRIYIYGARSAYDSTFRFFDISLPVNGSVVLFDAQIESGPPSPFVNGTRSSTASLIDLKRTTSIDVSNVTFDSTGQPTFDGTNDRITFDPGTFPSTWSQPFSVEAVVYVPSGATWYNQGSGTGIIGRGSYTGSWGLFRGGTDNSVYFWMRTGGKTFSPGGTISRDKHYHIVGTWDGTSQAIFYINGSQNSQETDTNVGSTVDSTGTIQVGGNVAFGGSNGGYGEGTYPVVKLYNKKLTAAEVKQNYNAYKNRFDI
jgi:hypothetical protein